MPDRFQNSSSALSSPASHAFAVTPSDSAVLAETTRAIYVGTTGSIAALMLSGASVSFTAIPAGTVLPLRLTKIMATGTSAGGIVALV
jgi:hypothetical protein